jgi:DNA-binding MarR family transcriptional regulator
MMELRPEGTIGYWLFYSQRCVEYAFFEILKQCCVEQGKSYVVTPPQWGVLSLLFFECDGRAIGTISQKRGFDAPTVTGIVTRLEQSGLVERRHDKEDHRVVKVYLTTEGKEMAPFLIAAVSRFNEITKQGLSTAEEKDFLAKIQQIVANMSAVAPGMGDRFHLLPGHRNDLEGNVNRRRA